MNDLIDLIRERRAQAARELAKLDAVLEILVDDGDSPPERVCLDGDLNVVLAPDGADAGEEADAPAHRCVWCRRTFKAASGLGRHRGACPKRPTEDLIGVPDEDDDDHDDDHGDDDGDDDDDVEHDVDDEDVDDDDDEMSAVNRQCRECGSLFPERRYLLIHAKKTDHDIDG